MTSSLSRFTKCSGSESLKQLKILDEPQIEPDKATIDSMRCFILLITLLFAPPTPVAASDLPHFIIGFHSVLFSCSRGQAENIILSSITKLLVPLPGRVNQFPESNDYP